MARKKKFVVFATKGIRTLPVLDVQARSERDARRLVEQTLGKPKRGASLRFMEV